MEPTMMDEIQESPACERSFVELVQEEDAQAAVEYVIIIGFVIMGAAVTFGVFPMAIRDYYTEVARVLALPIP